MSVEELEVLRKKARNISIIGTICSILVGIFVVITTKSAVFIFFCIVLGIIITTAIGSKPKRDFILSFKQAFVLKSLQSVFTDLNYRPESGLDPNIIGSTGMMYMGDRYTSNDYISGKYKNISVVQADVHIEEEQETTDSDGDTRTYWVTLFRGKWLIFDFNKSFKANVQVRQKNFSNSMLSRVNGVKYQKVMMEDGEFNKNFKVFAQDEHEAFYILTPSLMERIKRLDEKINSQLLFCFVDNKLHIGVQTNKDSFEPSIYKKIDEEKVINEISEDIKLITGFVDELNLDNDLFRKEVQV